MAELKQFLRMLERAEIQHEVGHVDFDEQFHPPGTYWQVTLCAGDKNVHGYSCFETTFFFTEKGNLLRVEIWE